MKIKYLILLAFICTGLATPVSANMLVSNSIIHFGGDQPGREDVEIENPTDEPMYIKVTPSIVHNPGTEDESRDVITNPKKAGLLVSPNKLVIPPGGRKLIRFVNLRPQAAQEHVYRVAITPVVNDVKANATGVKILIGYEVLVLTQPVNAQPVLVAERNGSTLNFRNDGNTNVLLREGYQCPFKTEDKEQCEPLNGKRIYPGNNWSVSLPLDRPVEYYLAVGRKNSVAVYQ
ncbi:MAG: molecular chaperone [Gammaproteobacteria bacterium]